MALDQPSRYRLSQAMRLRRSSEFATVKFQGQRLACGCLVINWREMPSGSKTRLGVITSRKVGISVARSRARRLLREVFRLHQHDLRVPVEVVLVARSSMANKVFASVERDYMKALRQANLIKRANP